MRETLEIILIIEVNIYTLNTITSFKIKLYTNECKYIQCSRKCLYCKKENYRSSVFSRKIPGKNKNNCNIMNYRLGTKILKKGSELAICHHRGCLQQEVKIRLMAPKFLSLLSSKRTLEVINLFLTIIKQSNKHSTTINRQIRQFNSVKSPEVTSCTLAIFCFCHWCHVQ